MFRSTIAALKPALSLMPMTRTTVTTAVMKTAGRLNHGHARFAPSGQRDGLARRTSRASMS